MSDEENESKEELKNLETVDYSKRERVQTPHSQFALSQLGILEEKLKKLSKEKYIEMHPELKNCSQEIKDLRFEHYNKRREEKIEKAKKLRKEILEDEKKNNNNNNDDNNNNEENSKKKYKSSAIQKEMEKLEAMKKQQLGEIKNMIDYYYKNEEIKKKNDEKMKLQEEKEEKIRLERERIKKEKEELEKKRQEEKIEKLKEEEKKKNKK